MAYLSLEAIVNACEAHGRTFYQTVLAENCREAQMSEEVASATMASMWQAMKEASRAYTGDRRSHSGMAGGDGRRMAEYAAGGHSLCGGFLGQVIAEALKMGESNACMRRIVAAPTAGACGVLPAVLIPVQQAEGISDQRMSQALYVAGGIGQIIAHRASLAGASGGCQAEVGSASGMAAGALVYLRDGTPDQICQATAMALKNTLGLVCDPVAGLVEVPCIKRNVMGAVNALSCADMALAGIVSHIPADQVIDAMREIGDDMPVKYKETACGGCAATPRGREIAARMSRPPEGDAL